MNTCISKRAMKKYKQRKEQPQDNKLAVIIQKTLTNNRDHYKVDTRYLKNSLDKVIQQSNQKVVVVKSPMGTGKTTSIKHYLDKHPELSVLYIMPRIALSRAVSSDLKLNNYQDSLNALDLQRLVISTNSLAKVLGDGTQYHYDLIVVDEAEAVTAITASELIKNPVQTYQCLKNLVKNSTKMLVMDANASELTQSLTELLVEDDYCLLENVNKPWCKLNVVDVIADEGLTAKEAISALIMDNLAAGFKLYVASSSCDYVDKLYTEIMRDRTTKRLNVLKITGTTVKTKAVRDLLADPKLITQYDAVLTSPVLDVGISFDESNHIDAVFGYYANADLNITPDLALQGMARVRAPKHKVWYVCLPTIKDKPKAIVNNAKLNQILQDDLKSQIGSDTYTISPLTIEIIEHSQNAALIQYNQKADFYKLFYKNLKYMQIKYKRMMLAKDAIANRHEASQAAELQVKRSKVYTLLTGKLMTDPEYDASVSVFEIAEANKQVPDFSSIATLDWFEMCYEERQEHPYSEDRYIFNRNYGVDHIISTVDELTHAYKLHNANATAAALRWERAELSVKDNNAMKAKIVTLAKANPKTSTLRYKHEREVFKILLRNYVTGATFGTSIKSKDQNDLVTYLKANSSLLVHHEILKAVTAAKLKKPWLLIKELLQKLNLKVASTKVGKSNVTVMQVDPDSVAEMEALLAYRKSVNIDFISTFLD